MACFKAKLKTNGDLDLHNMEFYLLLLLLLLFDCKWVVNPVAAVNI
jgi:hypothetical protein